MLVHFLNNNLDKITNNKASAISESVRNPKPIFGPLYCEHRLIYAFLQIPISGYKPNSFPRLDAKTTRQLETNSGTARLPDYYSKISTKRTLKLRLRRHICFIYALKRSHNPVFVFCYSGNACWKCRQKKH